jgi:hypothetical protein
MVNNSHNKNQSDATLASVTKEMDLPRLSASVERGTTKKLPSRLNDAGEKSKKRAVLKTLELSADLTRPTPLIHRKVRAARKSPPPK